MSKLNRDGILNYEESLAPWFSIKLGRVEGKLNFD